MVHLVGVMHTWEVSNFLNGRRRVFNPQPSHAVGLLISRLPRGSRVGVEDLSEGDWEELQADLEKVFDEDGFYGSGANYPGIKYWRDVARMCRTFGHEVVFLEDKEIWKRNSRARLEQFRVEEKYKGLVRKKDETDRDYHKKLITLNEEAWTAEARLNVIHALERDSSLLKRIAENNLTMAFAGIGHSEYWMSFPDIGRKAGVSFDRYSTDDVDLNFNPERAELQFDEEAEPDMEVAQEMVSIKNKAGFLDKRRLSDDIPDFAGIWDVHKPSRGYFELFIERRNGSRVKGVIEDFLGGAKFEGEMTDGRLRFDKCYVVSTKEAFKVPISYASEISADSGSCLAGRYTADGQSGPFYMERFQKSTPLEMSMRWYDLAAEQLAGQKRLF